MFIDGRALSESLYKDYRQILNNDQSSADAVTGPRADLLNHYDVQVVIMNSLDYVSGAMYPLALALANPASTEWHLVYDDSQDLIFVRGSQSSLQAFPDKLRRVHYVDAESSKSLVFLTNNLELPALTIALLYRSRWKVELFFKWIKQHLCIKHFYGTSDNAVKTQIWISVCVYVLVAIIKKQLRSQRSLYSILQVLSVNAFSKEPLDQVLKESGSQDSDGDICNQLIFNY